MILRATAILVVAFALACGDDDKPPTETTETTETAETPEQPAPGAVEIQIAADGAVEVMDIPTKAPDDVARALSAIGREMGEQACVVEADPAAPYAATLEVIEQCKRAGVHRVAVSSVDIALPEAATQPIGEQVMIAVTVDSDGALTVAGKPVADDELDARLRELLQQPGADVVVLPDRTLPTGRVVDVWKRALAAGVPEIRIVRIAEPRPLPKPKRSP